MNSIQRNALAGSVAACLCAPVTAQQFFQYTPVVSFTPTSFGAVAVHGPRVDVQDFDGDGLLDFATNNYWANQTAVFRNLGGATGFVGTVVPNLTGDDMFAGDLDGDGDPDLVQNNYTSIGWMLNDGTGTFPGPLGTLTMATGIIKDLARIDIDGDGNDEILAGRRIVGTGGYYFLEIYDYDATTNGITLVWSALNTTYQSTYEVFQAVDLDGDGDQDFVTCAGESYRNDTPQGSPSTPVLVLFASGNTGDNYSVASGDLNGDGRIDLAFANGGNFTSNDVRAYVQDFSCDPTTPYSRGSVTNWTIPGGGQAYWLDMADLDGDGRDDVILGYSGGSTPGVYKLGVMRSQGDGQLVDPFDLIGGSAQASMAAGAADFDNDGDIDVVGFNGNQVILFVNSWISATADPFEEVFTDAPTPPTTNFLWVDQASRSTSQTGTFDAPYRTLKAALAVATAGTAVMVKPGRYNACSDPDEQNTPLGAPYQLSNVQLIGVSGPERTFLYGMRFECDAGARISGFTMQNEGVFADAVIRMKDATVVGNRLFGGSPMQGIIVDPGNHTAYIGSNIVHGFRDGIRVEGGSASTTAVIYNNTSVRNAMGIVFGASNAITIRNNLVVDNSSYGIERDCSGPALNFLDVDYNWVSLNHSGNYVTTVPLPTQTCNSPITLGPGPTDMLSTWNMADFVDADGLDFHLVPTCLAIGRGGSLGVVPWLGIDVDGDPRSALNFAHANIATLHHPDIGADEVNSSRLGTSRHLVNWTLTTEMACATCFEGTVISWAPGMAPILDSLLLVDSNLYLGSFPLGFADPSVHIMPRTAWIPSGTRLYVQSVVVDANSGRLSFTNPIALTH